MKLNKNRPSPQALLRALATEIRLNRITITPNPKYLVDFGGFLHLPKKTEGLAIVDAGIYVGSWWRIGYDHLFENSEAMLHYFEFCLFGRDKLFYKLARYIVTGQQPQAVTWELLIIKEQPPECFKLAFLQRVSQVLFYLDGVHYVRRSL